MLNYRVHDLDAKLDQLRSAGVVVEDRVEEFDYGRFGWVTDPEGNRFELWEARSTSAARSPGGPVTVRVTPHLSSVRLPGGSMIPVRGDRFWAVVHGELNVPYVVRARLTPIQ